MSEHKRFSHKTEVVFVIGILAVALVTLWITKATGLPFKSFTESDVLSIIASLFVIAVFMERSVEAILTPIRAPDRQKIEKELNDLPDRQKIEKKINDLNELFKALKKDDNKTELREKIEKELNDLNEDLEALKKDDNEKEWKETKTELAVYKLNTARYAYWLSFVFGIIISLFGVRTLAGLVEPEALESLKTTLYVQEPFCNYQYICDKIQKTFWNRHYYYFSGADIILTGGVIAGGSAAIDKIGRTISRFFNLRSAVDGDEEQK